MIDKELTYRELQLATLDVYHTFEVYLHGGSIEKDQLRIMTKEDLVPFARLVFTTGLPALELKRVLPRVFEVLAFDTSGENEPPLVIGIGIWYAALAVNEWTTWPQPEQQAITKFNYAYWRWTLGRYPGQSPMGLLSVISQITEDLSPYLAIWTKFESMAPLQHLGSWLSLHLMSVVKKKSVWSSRFSTAYPRQANQVLNWLLGRELLNAVENICLMQTKETKYNQIADIVSHLQTLRDAFNIKASGLK